MTKVLGNKPVAGSSGKSPVIAEVKLDAKTPIPFEIGGMYYTLQGERYVPFLGIKDTLFNSLHEARLCSVSQSACIGTITDYTIGNGIYVSNLKEGQNAGPEWKNFYKYANGKRQSLNMVLRRIVDGFLTCGNQPVEVVCGTAAGKRYIYIYPKNMMDCRLSAPNDQDENENLLISRAFRKEGISTINYKNFKVLPIYKPGMQRRDKYFKVDGNVKRTIIYMKNEVAGIDYYGLPSSIASLIYQLLEYGAARFNLDNLENNMVVGGAVFLTGNLSGGEADRIGRDIIKKHTGKGKAGRVAVISTQEGIEDVKYVPFQTQKEGSYEKTDETAETKIIFANKWDAVLAGLKAETSIGKGAGYLKEIYDQKYKTVIRPLINQIMEQLMVPLCEIADDWLGTTWSRQQFDMQPIDITDGTSKAGTEIDGIRAFLEIVQLVADGTYSYEGAVQLVMGHYKLTKAEAEGRLGVIEVKQKQDPGTAGTDPAPIPKK